MERTQTSVDEFCCHAVEATTLSAGRRPSEGETAWIADVTLRDLLALDTFPVWYVDDSGRGSIGWDSPAARATRFREAAKRDDFRQLFRREWSTQPSPQLVALGCDGCSRVAIIDGNHRLMKFVDDGNLNMLLRVWGLSGTRWPMATPDLNVICVCPRARPG